MTATDQAAESRRLEIAAAWLLCFADGPLTLEQEIEFELWLDTDATNRKMFQEVAEVWSRTGELSDLSELAGVRADALRALHEGGGRPARWLGGRWRALLAAAACLLLVASASLMLWHGRGDTYQTAVGERRVVTLADGSRISLDASTTVEVAYNGERRALRLLGGRAKFDVAKDPRRPFTVSAGGKMVVATGTAFSVELVHSQMQVILYEGAVAVLENGPGDQPPRHLTLAAARGAADNALKPGRILIAPLDGPSATVAPVDAVRSLSWEAGQMTFSDEPLSVAVERMNRYSREKVTIGNEATGRLRVSGAFNAGDTEGFVDGVSTLYQLRKTRSDDGIALGAGS